MAGVQEAQVSRYWIMVHTQAEALVVGAAAKAWADGPLAEQRLSHARLEESWGSGPSVVDANARQRPPKVWCLLHDAIN